MVPDEPSLRLISSLHMRMCIHTNMPTQNTIKTVWFVITLYFIGAQAVDRYPSYKCYKDGAWDQFKFSWKTVIIKVFFKSSSSLLSLPIIWNDAFTLIKIQGWQDGCLLRCLLPSLTICKWIPYGRKRDLTHTSCPLTPICVPCMLVHTQNVKKKPKNQVPSGNLFPAF